MHSLFSFLFNLLNVLCIFDFICRFRCDVITNGFWWYSWDERSGWSWCSCDWDLPMYCCAMHHNVHSNHELLLWFHIWWCICILLSFYCFLYLWHVSLCFFPPAYDEAVMMLICDDHHDMATGWLISIIFVPFPMPSMDYWSWSCCGFYILNHKLRRWVMKHKERKSKELYNKMNLLCTTCCPPLSPSSPLNTSYTSLTLSGENI